MERHSSRSSPASGIRLLIVDEHRLFCAGLEQLFRTVAGIEQVGFADGLEQGQQEIRRMVPHVVLLNPGLSRCGPFETVRALRTHCPAARFLFLDNSVRPIHLRAALELRAAGYWTKHATFDEILWAVRRAGAGESTFCPAVQDDLVPTRRGLLLKPSAQSTLPERLTRRELEALLYLSRGLTVKQCATLMKISRSTVENHKSKLMRKLQVHKMAELAVIAVREGLLD